MAYILIKYYIHKTFNYFFNNFEFIYSKLIHSIKMKSTQVSQSRISKLGPQKKQQQKKHKQKNVNYLQLSNQQFLRRNLILLGVTQANFLKQTKSSLQSEFFPKNQTNPTGTKQFFYISFFCLEKLTNNDEINSVQMWYPPRTVSEQLEYKKAFFKALQNLQILGRVPKNIIVSKGTIMGDTTSGVLVQFLRFFSQMALRHQYLEKYSKKERLIQLCCNFSGSPIQNNINKFYVHPFVPSPTTISFDHPSIDLNLMKQVHHDYLKIYFKKLIKLRTNNINPVLAEAHQSIMRSFMEQKQLSQTLSKKIPSSLLGENRAFDRRRIIDKNQQIWDQLNKIQCHYVQQQQIPVLKLEGQVDQILQKWQPAKGISNVIQANLTLKQTSNMKKQLELQRARFKELCDKIEDQIKK